MRLWYVLVVSIIGFLPISNVLYGQDYKNPKQLIKGADAAFDKGDYKAAAPLYSQLVSNFPKDPEYNYKYGASLLFAGSDKEKPIKFLQFAVSKPDVDPLAYYYYGLGLHLNYEFRKAIKYYKKFQTNGKDADKKRLEVNNAIVQCENGTTLLKTITDLIVLDKKDLQEADFYKVYDLTEFGGRILVKTEDFQSDYEKKNEVKDIFYFPKNADKIFFTRQNSQDGSKDIYYKVRNPDGTWSRSISMGKPVNTKFDEDYPFMHPDGTSLYFASKGHNSLGGYDIFVTRLDAEGNWTEPKNLDFAINTPADDYLFITDLKGETAYFTSNRESPIGEVSVYRINMDRVPLDFAFVYGTFNSDNTKKAHIKIVNAETQAIIGEYDTDENGKYKVKLPNEGKFNFIVDYENSTVAHSGLVEIQGRDAFKPLKQSMEVLNQGTDDEKLVIKNLIDDDVEQDVELTAEYLKNKAKLSINKDKFKDRKKKEPELVAENNPDLNEEKAGTLSGATGANNGQELADVGKAATSIASEKKINETTQTDGPSLEMGEEDNSSASNSNETGNSNLGEAKGDSNDNSRDSEKSKSSIGSTGSSGSASSVGGSAVNIGAGTVAAAGVATSKKLTLNAENGSKEEILEVTSNNKEALANDEEIYNKQAEISRKIASLSSSQAAAKRLEADKKLAEINSSETSSEEELKNPDYIEAQELLSEANYLDRKAVTSEKITNDLEQNAQRSQDLQLVSGTYSSQIENQNDETTNNKTYDDYETRLNENLSKQNDLGDLQKEYVEAYQSKNVEARNQKAKSDAMHEEILEIEEDIEVKETKLASAKGKEKSTLEAEIATDKADLKTEREGLVIEEEKTQKLAKEVNLLKADADAINELISQSNSDEEIAELTRKASYVEEVTPSTDFVSSVSNDELAQASSSSSNSNDNDQENENLTNESSSEGEKQSSSNLNADELAANSGNEGSRKENDDENADSLSETDNTNDENGTGNNSNNEDESENEKELAVVNNTSTSNQNTETNDAENGKGSSNSKSVNSDNGESSSARSRINTPTSAEGIAVGAAVSSSSAAWNAEDIDPNEVLDVNTEDDLTANEMAVLLDSNSEKVSAFIPEEINDEITKSDQSLASINRTGYNKKYNDQFLDLIEEDGSDYEKAVKTYVINESRLLDIEKEISYLDAIENDVPEEYQGNVSERIANLENLQNTVFNNTLNSRERMLALAESEGTSDDLKTLTNDSRKQLNEKVDPVLVAKASDESLKAEETEALASQSNPANNSDNANSENEGSSESDAQNNSSNEGNENKDNTSENSTDGALALNQNGNEESFENVNNGDSTEDSSSSDEAESSNSDNSGNDSNGSESNNESSSNSNSGNTSSTESNLNDGANSNENKSNVNGLDEAIALNEVSDNNESGTDENNGSQNNSSNANDPDNSNNEIVGANESEDGNGNTGNSSSSNSGNSNENGGQNASGQTGTSNQGSSSSNLENNSGNSNEGNSNSESDSGSNSSSSNGVNQGDRKGTQKSVNSNATEGSTNSKSNGKGEIPKTEIVPGESSNRLARVYDAPEKSMQEVVGSKTESAIKEKEIVDAEVAEMETELTQNQTKLTTAKRKEKKTLAPQVAQQEKDVADAKNQQEIADYRISALARAADVVIALEPGEERESQKEVKRAETLKVEAEEKFVAADEKEAEKARGKKKKAAKSAEVSNLKGEGERKLAQASASEKLAVELADLEDEVVFTYKNTPEAMPVSDKRLSQAEVNEVRKTSAFAEYDGTRKEAAEYYKKAQVAYVKAENLENDNKKKKVEILELNNQLDAEGDVDKISELQESIKTLQNAIVLNEQSAAAYKKESQDYYSEYNHTNNQAVRMIKSQEPQLQENLVAYANQLEREGTYYIAPIEGSSLANEDPVGYSPEQFSRVVKGIDDYPAELTDAIFDMMDFNKSLYNSDNPIPVDTKLPGGVVYKVQIGAFRKPPPEDVFKGFAPVRGENTRPGWVRYTAGLFMAKDQAQLKRNEIRALGYSDAFVVAYKDGKRISLSDAEKLITEGYKAPASSGSTSATASSSDQAAVKPGEVLPVSEIQGLLYTVQVGAFRNKVTTGQLFGITPLVEYQQSGLYKYGSGVYNDKNKAESAKSQVLAAGVQDAFVTAFYNGKRISLNEAATIAKQGPSVFAKESPISIGKGSRATAGSIVFRVQVGAYRQEVPIADAKIILSLSNLGLDVQQNADLTTYTVGRYGNYSEAKQVLDRVKGQGLNGAFVVAYENGIRIEVQDALNKLGQ